MALGILDRFWNRLENRYGGTCDSEGCGLDIEETQFDASDDAQDRRRE